MIASMNPSGLSSAKATGAWPSYYLEGTVTHFNSEKGFGFVKCRDGREFFFGFRVVEEKRFPRVGDKVQFLPSYLEPKPGKAPEIKRMRFAKLVPGEVSLQEDGLDDGMVRCPNCGKRVMPRVVTWRGSPESTYCPLCGGLIKQFIKPLPEPLDKTKPGEFGVSLIGMFVAAALTALLVVFIAN